MNAIVVFAILIMLIETELFIHHSYRSDTIRNTPTDKVAVTIMKVNQN